MRKKSIYWAGMVLGLFSLFILAGCGKESSQEQAAIEFQQRDGEEPFHSAVTVIDFGAEWNQPDNWLHCEPLDENNWLLWQRRGDWENGEREDAPNVETLLCLYDSKENQVKKTLVLPGYHYVDVKEDKIILTENREVYWMDRELAYTSERTPLPGFLFERMDKDGKEYGYAEYDISSDLQWIVYACRVRGLNLYHMETGETKLLRGAEEYPFWYEEDFDWWRSPMGLGFLPGDKEFMLLSDGFSVYDLEGKEIFQAAAGTVADIWGYYWHTHSGEPLLCFYEDYKSQPYRLLAEQVDVGNKQVGERRVVPGALTGENFPENGAGVVYNQNYFAWVISCSSTNGEESGNSGRKIVVYDVATLTPTVVLESSYGHFDLRGIDEEGRVFFSWQPFGGDPEEPAVINGITAPVTQKQ